MIEKEKSPYSDTHNLWTIFSQQNDLELKISRVSNISDGGKTKLLTLELRNRNLGYTISQSFTQSDSWLEFIDSPHILTCLYVQPVGRNINISIWRKTKWERFFNLNITSTGNPVFDNTFSANSTDKQIQQKLFQDRKIQEMMLSNDLLIFNIATNNNYMTVSLKDMGLRFYTYHELEMMNLNIKYIIETHINPLTNK